MSTPDKALADEMFRMRAEMVTGMRWDEIMWWGERVEFEQQQYAKDRGHCCWAGMVGAPEPCPWHSRASRHT
ncbi:hypothetical protein ABZY58_11570 [Micromonospora tulbaghiae]|uniref:hypothetical protein n=1 Tax=Micromonospora tulbaghiae TaxID=479978 RepID=UPI0033B5B415